VSPNAYVFSVPAQKLRASDRILTLPGGGPELIGRTVLYVRSARDQGPATPYAPVYVICTPPAPPASGFSEADVAADEMPPRLAWGTRLTVERVPGTTDEYLVSALEPLTRSSRFEVRALSALTIERDAYPEAWPGDGDARAGAVVAELIDKTDVLEDASRLGELVSAWWYVDNHRLETPGEHSARDAADLFADQEVRLRPAGSDAGETCPTCGHVITWVDHLPPNRQGTPVRCQRGAIR
jgi:hypothetical protein